MTDLPERLRMLSESLDDVDYPVTAKADCLKAARIVELFYRMREREIHVAIGIKKFTAGFGWTKEKETVIREYLEAETEAMVEEA